VTVNWSVRRDWAASSGGGSVVSFTGPDYTPDCGPAMLIDQSQVAGWGSNVGAAGDQIVLPPPERGQRLPTGDQPVGDLW